MNNRAVRSEEIAAAAAREVTFKYYLSVARLWRRDAGVADSSRFPLPKVDGR